MDDLPHASAARGKGKARGERAVVKLGEYHLGEQIGKGGYGTVFKGLRGDTGEFVAVKRISLQSIPPDELQSIQSEINLLKKLNHPNIVKYIDMKQTDDFLHIVLEFMENGSLSDIIKRFGVFSESLAGIYISQVLQGLQYLHTQGVIHRDIKGANILTSKDGQVKLADFGVAIKLSEATKSHSVVGTPYWMAPEIIEMAGPTSACDIWSVGCTVVELLTGKPPFFDLAPMTALFRIVQDDHPPLPEAISPAATDFLLECFKKEPSFRKSAAQLLTHPWVTNQLKKAPKSQLRNMLERAGGSVPQSERESIRDSVMRTIRLYERTVRLDKQTLAQAQRQGAAAAAASSGAEEEAAPDDEDMDDWDLELGGGGEAPNPLALTAPADLAGASAPMSLSAAAGGSHKRAGTGEQVAAAMRALQGAHKEAEEEDGPRPQPLPALGAVAVDDLFWDDAEDDTDVNAASLKATGAPATAPATLAPLSDTATAPPAAVTTAAVSRQAAGGRLRGQRKARGAAAAAAAAATTAPTAASPDRHAGAAAPAHFTADDDADDWGDVVMGGHARQRLAAVRADDENDSDWDDVDVAPAAPAGPATAAVAARGGSAVATTTAAAMAGEGDEEDMSAFGDELEPDGVQAAAGAEEAEDDLDAAALAERLQQRLRRAEAEPEEGGEAEFGADLFDELDFEEDEERDIFARQSAEVVRLLALLQPDKPDAVVVGACQDLTELFRQSPAMRRHLRAHHGVIQLMTILESPSPAVPVAALGLINEISRDDPRFQENMALVGMLPIVNRFAAAAQPPRLRLQAALFVWQTCAQSLVALQMFVACGGLGVLVELLRPTRPSHASSASAPAGIALSPAARSAGRRGSKRAPLAAWGERELAVSAAEEAAAAVEAAQMAAVAEASDTSAAWEGTELAREVDGRLARVAIQCIERVFALQTIPRNDFCRLLAKSSLLEHLVPVFVALYEQWTQQGQQGKQHRQRQHKLPDAQSWAPMDGEPGDFVQRVADVLVLFSQGDAVVRQHMASPRVLRGMIHVVRSWFRATAPEHTNGIALPPASVALAATVTSAGITVTSVADAATMSAGASLATSPLLVAQSQVVIKLVKCVKHVSMDPATLRPLEQAGAIQTLVPLLAMNVMDMSGHVLYALFNLCKISGRRQERAAVAGVVPHLMVTVQDKGPPRQLALQIVCDMAHATACARRELWRNGGVKFFLEQLQDNYWRTHALTSLAVWLTHDTERVESVLLRAEPLVQLVRCFRAAKETGFENLLEPLLTMMHKSTRLCQALARCSLYVSELAMRLRYPKAIVQRNLLDMLQLVFTHHPCPARLLEEHDVYTTVADMAREDAMVIVMEIASRLLRRFDELAAAFVARDGVAADDTVQG